MLSPLLIFSGFPSCLFRVAEGLTLKQLAQLRELLYALRCLVPSLLASYVRQRVLTTPGEPFHLSQPPLLALLAASILNFCVPVDGEPAIPEVSD